MADRKTINKYYPPDFDPAKLVKSKRQPRTGSASLPTVRLMSPFSMRCTTCGEYIYKGKKFNARKQPTGESYLGISIIRFYIRCPRCSGEIRFKTDPRNSDYVTENGAERNLEPWRDREKEEETLEDRLLRLEKEEAQALVDAENEKNGIVGGGPAGSAKDGGTASDPFAGLEEKVNLAKREMEIQDELEELRMRNARFEELGAAEDTNATIMSALSRDTGVTAQKRREDEEDDATAKEIFGGINGVRVHRAAPSAPRSIQGSSSGGGGASILIPTTVRVSKKRGNRIAITVKKAKKV